MNLRKEKKPLITRHYEDLVDLKNGYLFCKGVFVKQGNTFYSYNFKDKELNPDRNNFISSFIPDEIAGIIAGLNNTEIIKAVIRRMISYYKENEDKGIKQLPYEFLAAEKLNKYLEKGKMDLGLILWKTAFEDLFKDKSDSQILGTVLKSGEEIPESLKGHLNNYRLVSLPKEWVQFLSAIGVQTDKDLIPDYTEEVIKTSLTDGYGSEIWGLDRMFLDACQNHLPSDSSGKNTFVRFQSRDGKWHDCSELAQFEDDDILRIKIADDGIGYDSNSLGLLASAKEQR